MDLEQKFKKITGFDAYIDNQMQPKVYNESYVEWLEHKLSLHGVSQQRELLKTFLEHIEGTVDFLPCEPNTLIDDYFNNL